MSTNVTRFFREESHYAFTERAVTAWAQQGQKRFRVWSAASSSGQEPYSVAITVSDALRRAGQVADFRLLGTDISTRILDRARAAVYSEDEVERVKPAVRKAHFIKEGEGGTATYQVRQAIRDLCVFKRMNLNEPPFPMRGPMDLIYCCNVMIYFDDTTRRRLIAEFARLLRPDGYLLISHTETLNGLTNAFRMVQPSIYQKHAGSSVGGSDS